MYIKQILIKLFSLKEKEETQLEISNMYWKMLSKCKLEAVELGKSIYN